MMTKSQAQALAAFIHEMRNDWDAPGVLAQLAKVNHLNAYEVTHALLRLAENPAAKTPGPMSNTTGEHWRETARNKERLVAPRRDESCMTCGRYLSGCICGEQRTKPWQPGDTQTGADAARIAAGLAPKHATTQAAGEVRQG